MIGRVTIELIPLERQPTLGMSRRKAREAYRLNRGKTLSPDGLNRKDKRWTVTYRSLYFIIIYLSIMLAIVFIFSLSLISCKFKFKLGAVMGFFLSVALALRKAYFVSRNIGLK